VGACPPSQSIEVTAGVEILFCGVLMIKADQTTKWVNDMRKGSNSLQRRRWLQRIFKLNKLVLAQLFHKEWRLE
jgi:hypothetical protein